jgi:methylenetetrahydrofolate--tRNA-(uracil-5-)-methyltransferase
VGLPDPKTGKEPYAVVQLRKDNKGGTLYNIVGFQTHLTFGEQKRVFSMIPGLFEAEFVRYGVMHRNTFINSPRLLDDTYMVRAAEGLYFAGQITGVEGYVESAASGLVAGLNLARRLGGAWPIHFPRETAIGALGAYISDPSVGDFQPMNINFGLMEPLGYKIKGKQNKKEALSQRALYILDDYISNALYAY